jgi:hypothetical protein
MLRPPLRTDLIRMRCAMQGKAGNSAMLD